MPDPTGTNLTEAEAKQINASAPISQTFKTGERLRNLRTDLQELREVGCTLTAAAESNNVIAVTLQAQRDGEDVTEAGVQFKLERYDANGNVNTGDFAFVVGAVGGLVTAIVTTDAAGQASFSVADISNGGNGGSGDTISIVATPWPSGKAIAASLTFD